MSAITKHDMKAILGEDFFKEEIRCDYLVSPEMKSIWAVLIDMYLSFAEICEKYNLKYFVIAGTMLGAIRHNGFIPWDDDLDVGMFREDYEEFLKIAAKDFNHPLFLQTPYNDPGYYVSWAKIRNSTTTGISKVTNHRRFNQGLYLDIFPFDYCNPELANEDRSLIYVCAKKCGAYMRMGSKHLNDRQKQDAITYFTDNPLSEWEKLQHIASNPTYKQYGYVTNAVFTGYSVERQVYPISGFNSVIKHKFENIEINVPCGWDEQLRILYGNYMEFPPIEKRGNNHSDIIFDPNNPYTHYLE